MRVIAGRLGGRIFNSPHGHRTHPMSDKVRGALFNMLGDIEGLTVLDPFAGSGALGFEAVSRGAASALLIERDKNAQKTIGENITALGVSEQVTLLKAFAKSWLNRSPDTFDLILLDPPYDDLQVELLERLATRANPGGRIVLSWPGKTESPRLQSVKEVSAKHYGDASLYVYEPL
jgi:16S rRNA (guanine966-N2)-methyltransferase